MPSLFLSLWLLTLLACDPASQHLGVLPEATASSVRVGGAPSSSGGIVITITQRTGGQIATMETGGLQSGGTVPPPPNTAATGGSDSVPTPSYDCGLVLSELSRAQVVLVVDTSFSISVSTLNPIAEGLSTYARDVRSAGSEMALFVLRNTSCGTGVYTSADVPLGRLPDHAAAIESGVPPVQVNLATQPEEAVGAAVTFTSPLIGTSDGHRAAVGLLTDGFTFGFCTSSTAAALQSVIAGAQQMSPPVATYVVPLVAGAFNASNWTAGATPDELAVAGGTGHAYSANIASGPSPANAINEALQQVRADLQPCRIRVTSGTVPADMRVALSGGNEIPQVANEQSCANDHGYYFDNPTNWLAGASLCPQTCTLIKSQGITALEFGSHCP